MTADRDLKRFQRTRLKNSGAAENVVYCLLVETNKLTDTMDSPLASLGSADCTRGYHVKRDEPKRDKKGLTVRGGLNKEWKRGMKRHSHER